ncbi:hypothetical protein Acor_64440 [Acrocarpospora corrugata]|uniref:Uncharacterized protein n=1 Tax=Acrocarpospora corrugata TaxID=35763 RepID=A0A5M3W6H4_9ACTN|nr:hypothetical protein Acor_64440 [Acrocarpospora corrugata]
MRTDRPLLLWTVQPPATQRPAPGRPPTREFLAGYQLVDVESEDQAIELAARISALRISALRISALRISALRISAARGLGGIPVRQVMGTLLRAELPPTTRIPSRRTSGSGREPLGRLPHRLESPLT